MLNTTQLNFKPVSMNYIKIMNFVKSQVVPIPILTKSKYSYNNNITNTNNK